MPPALWILIPAKAAAIAKRRLAPLLAPEKRAALTRTFLENTLMCAVQGAPAARLLVITSDADLAASARRSAALVLPDPPDPTLNRALEAGRAYALEEGAESLLVLPTDLPYLTPAALRAFLAHAAVLPAPYALLAPDREGIGTNALLLRPPSSLFFRFGANSAALHRSEAQKRGIPFAEYRDPAFERDIDTPDHYLEWTERVAL